MSRFSSYSSKKTAETNSMYETVVENFMGGNSFTLSPLQTLKIVAASSIFGEPQYYRDGVDSLKTISNHLSLAEYSIFNELLKDKRSAAEVFEAAIDAALDYDFHGTLELAKELRNDYYMRLNPAVIYVRAVQHKDRAKFNESYPGYMRELAKKIALRPDDMTNQFDYFMYKNKSKKGLPSIMKRSWADVLETMSRYQLNKYKGKKLIDLVRISHANNEVINELMKTGALKIEETEQTWESLRSAGKTWTEIIETIKIPHMALLRNLRGIFTEISDFDQARKITDQLLGGVLAGKQFPFRYLNAYNAISSSEEINHKSLILDTLENCMDIAAMNMPKISGRVMSLCDNSGSAQGTTNTEYGTVTVSSIANLSAVITATRADEGYIGIFGDALLVKDVSKRNGILSQAKEADSLGTEIGLSTEHGIWLFWDKAIREKQHWDTVFIYSDMQAGHGELYGNSADYQDYTVKGNYIDVLALVRKYRKEVNPKVNIFSVQVAGYNNSVLPENLYRGAILAGWTGKETHYADMIIKTWDEIEKN